jgi:probable addiction module antidote protein
VRQIPRQGRLRTKPFDAARYLDDERTVIAYLNEVLAESDSSAVVDALGTVARAKGMAKLARTTGLGRESLYKALNRNGNPSFRTVLGVAAALGYRFELSSVRSRRRSTVPYGPGANGA